MKQVKLHGFSVEIGDRVWDWWLGWGTVTSLRPESDCPIQATFANGDAVYAETGGLSPQRSPRLFWQPEKITPTPKRRPYNASGSLSEYGIFPERDATPAAARDVTIEELREALEEIRSRSSMNFAMRPDPFELTARLGDIYQIADAALAQETKA